MLCGKNNGQSIYKVFSILLPIFFYHLATERNRVDVYDLCDGRKKDYDENVKCVIDFSFFAK